MQLSPNQEIFCEFFSAFKEATYILKYFGKEDEARKLFVSEIIDRKKGCYLNA